MIKERKRERKKNYQITPKKIRGKRRKKEGGNGMEKEKRGEEEGRREGQT